MLYNFVECPHRVTMDLRADTEDRDPPNAFVELLWERGSQYEREVINRIESPVLDLSQFSELDKERRTSEAMERGEPLIYGGRIQAAGLLGYPDLLRKQATGYVAGDIKSGSGEEGPEDNSKPKIRYAVQLGLYTDILERRGLSGGRRAFVWDVHGREVIYDLQIPYGKRSLRTLWQDYEEALHAVQSIIEEKVATLPAFGAVCKLCHWYSACIKRIKELDDLTMIPELGRSKRDVMYSRVRTVERLANENPETFIKDGKSAFPGIGPETLRKFHKRAKLLSEKDARPYARSPILFPRLERELFFDVEVDPMRDVCYLHGFVERVRRDNTAERFVSTFAEDATLEAERRAFADAWRYLQGRRPCAIYYYSKYERTTYRALQEKYPDVCGADDIEELFDSANAIDLYDVVRKTTEWPTWDYSVKTLAKYLGFAWRDTHPSGAASIEWFHRWTETTDPEVRQRILDYNEDDCRATRVLRDALEGLPVTTEGAA